MNAADRARAPRGRSGSTPPLRMQLGDGPASEAMSTNNQWDVNKAMTLASLFHFFYGASNACTVPFLTLYFRQLGLTAPLVGIIIGLKHLITSLWAPLCSYLAKTHNKRKVLITGSLLCSAGASLLLTVIPPLSKDVAYKYCNGSQRSGKLLTATQEPDTSTNSLSTVNFGPITDNNTLSTGSVGMASNDRTTAGMPAGTKTLKENSSLKIPSEINNQDTDINTDKQEFTDGSSGETSISEKEIIPVEQKLKTLSGEGSVETTRSPTSGIMNINERSEGNGFSERTAHFSLRTSLVPFTETSYIFKNLSNRRGRAQDLSSRPLQRIDFLNSEHKVFLMVLGAVVLWELLVAPLAWMVDDSLYEYLDFVDAADKYENLWIWSYLGASMGVCSVAVFVDQLSCFLSANIPRFAVHFYGYALMIMLTFLVSVFFPIPMSQKNEHVNKTGKALNLIGSDGRTILCAVTVFLTGAIGSAVQNFLFWEMQDQGSSELNMGLAVAVGLTAEILLYLFKSKLLRALSGAGTVALSLISLALQLLYYSFLWNTWAVLPVQIFCAFSNGALWWAVNMMADDIATLGTERSLHLVLQGLSCGCGASLGSFAGGFVVNSFGLAVLYRACSITLILWLILFLIVHSRLPRQRKINYSRLLAADSSDTSDSDEDRERDWLVKAMRDDHFQGNR